MEKEKLDKILENHKLWLNNEGGACADLRGIDLRGIDLRYANLRNTDLYSANLRGADLRYAHLRYANLRGTNLRSADLRYADLRNTDLNHTKLYDADLSGANLRYANLYDADLKNTNLRNTDLYSADLRGADLNSADLRGANLYDIDLRGANLYDANLTDIKTNIHTIGYNLACPEEGSFIAYKKAKDCIIKLLILEDSKRSSATSIKCRCDKAKVLDIEKIDTGEKVESISSSRDNDFIYKVGEIVKVDDFDENRWNECSTGIHFFMNKQNAIKY
jgi:hypothetical protein